jgi:transposase InsO family protein
VIGQPRATQRRRPIIRDDEDALTAAIIRLATTYGRYGYRRIAALLGAEGWRVNLKRVYRIWRQEGLKVPQKQPKRGRLWLNDGSCIRLRATSSRISSLWGWPSARATDANAANKVCLGDVDIAWR